MYLVIDCNCIPYNSRMKIIRILKHMNYEKRYLVYICKCKHTFQYLLNNYNDYNFSYYDGFIKLYIDGTKNLPIDSKISKMLFSQDIDTQKMGLSLISQYSFNRIMDWIDDDTITHS